MLKRSSYPSVESQASTCSATNGTGLVSTVEDMQKLQCPSSTLVSRLHLGTLWMLLPRRQLLYCTADRQSWEILVVVPINDVRRSKNAHLRQQHDLLLGRLLEAVQQLVQQLDGGVGVVVPAILAGQVRLAARREDQACECS